MKTLMDISGAELTRELRAAARPVLVFFFTSWSGQDQLLGPACEALADDFAAEIQIARVNLDHCPEVAKRYGLTEIPALLLFDSGVPIARLDAWRSPAQLQAELQGLLADYETRPGRGGG